MLNPRQIKLYRDLNIFSKAKSLKQEIWIIYYCFNPQHFDLNKLSGEAGMYKALTIDKAAQVPVTMYLRQLRDLNVQRTWETFLYTAQRLSTDWDRWNQDLRGTKAI